MCLALPGETVKLVRLFRLRRREVHTPKGGLELLSFLWCVALIIVLMIRVSNAVQDNSEEF